MQFFGKLSDITLNPGFETIVPLIRSEIKIQVHIAIMHVNISRTGTLYSSAFTLS